MILVNDLFAGGGGSITGAEMVEGVQTQWAANHLKIAIDTLERNHPGVQPVLQDLMQADFYQMPPCYLLSASPECRGHAKCRGTEQARHDASRSTAYAPLMAIDALYHRKKLPKVLIVENVPEFLGWIAYKAWRFTLETYGYRFTELVLNAADFGVPVTRERLFLVGVHGRRSLDLPPHIWPKERHVPAIEHIRWDEGTWNPIIGDSRRDIGLKPLKPATLAQIEHGRRTYGDRFLIRYNGAQRDRDQVAQNPFQPIGSLTTKPRFGVVKIVGGEARVRMMSIMESKTAMGFPPSYWLPSKLEDGHKLIGNAVSPIMMKGVLERVLERVA